MREWSAHRAENIFHMNRTSKRGGESEGGDKGGEGEREGKIISQVNEKRKDSFED
jgi:hypothetical protein